MLNENRIHRNPINDIHISRSRIKPRLKSFVHVEGSDIDDITEAMEVHIY